MFRGLGVWVALVVALAYAGANSTTNEKVQRTAEETVRLLQKEFNDVDTDGNGSLNYDEVDHLFRAFLTEDIVKKERDAAQGIMGEFAAQDTDKSKGISLDEYTRAKFGVSTKTKSPPLQLKEFFVFFDGNRDGELSFEEYKDAYDPYKSSRRNEYLMHEVASEMETILDGQTPGLSMAVKITWEQYKKFEGVRKSDDFESTDHLQKEFNIHDTNKDGAIDAMEYRDWHFAEIITAKGPIELEIDYIMRHMVAHRHDTDVDDNVRTIKISMEDIKTNSEFAAMFLLDHVSKHGPEFRP
jgi:Ca2+-binding EF-hand superfamily protein